jgi:tetratricopeptide (TPR) repeat protein
LEQLQAEAAAHVNLAHHYYRRLAKTCALMERRRVGASMDVSPTNRTARLAQRCAPKNSVLSSVYYYRLALDEYRAAITRDPTQIQALTGYADTFWEWWLNRPRSDALAGPTLAMAEQAERYARQAFALSRTQSDIMTQATTRASRGRVLLAIGQSMKAIEELEPALAAFETTHGATTPHPIVQEMRWDLAQAYRCAVNNDRGGGGLLHDRHQSLHKKAEDLLTSIQHDEAIQEFQAYQREPSLLDVKRGLLVCGWDYFQKKGMEPSGLSTARHD